MSELEQHSSTAAIGPPPASGSRGDRRGRDDRVAATPTGWVGWIAFAGFMMIIEGGFQCIQGLVALFKDNYYLVNRDGLVIGVDYSAWGVVHLLLGLVMLAAGLGLLRGQLWARLIGIVLAVLSALVNMIFLAAYPLWSAMVIVVDVTIIYALIVHGRESKARTQPAGSWRA